MSIRIHNYSVPKKERDLDSTVLSLRLTRPEAVRFWQIMDNVKARNPYIGKSDVFRELLGLANPQAVTLEEIMFFRQGKGVSGVPYAGTVTLTSEKKKKDRQAK